MGESGQVAKYTSVQVVDTFKRTVIYKQVNSGLVPRSFKSLGMRQVNGDFEFYWKVEVAKLQAR